MDKPFLSGTTTYNPMPTIQQINYQVLISKLFLRLFDNEHPVHGIITS